MKPYEVWTYDAVRAQIIEAADTLMLGEPDRGPGFAGLLGDVVRDVAEAYGYGSSTYRRIPSPGALSRMEQAWSWINTYLDEPDRRLVYEYGFIKCRRGLTLGRWCEKNGWVERTFERAIKRCCQRIADNLNRIHAIRLTNAVDDMSANQTEQPPSEVASDSRAQVKHGLYYRAEGAEPAHIPGSEADIAKHIEKVNRQRREEAERQRKAELRRREDAARLAAQAADRAKRKLQKAA